MGDTIYFRALLQECPLHDSKPCNFVFHISHCGSTTCNCVFAATSMVAICMICGLIAANSHSTIGFLHPTDGRSNAPRRSIAIEPTDADRTEWIQFEPHTTSIDLANGIKRWERSRESSSASAKLVVHTGRYCWEWPSRPDKLCTCKLGTTTGTERRWDSSGSSEIADEASSPSKFGNESVVNS